MGQCFHIRFLLQSRDVHELQTYSGDLILYPAKSALATQKQNSTTPLHQRPEMSLNCQNFVFSWYSFDSLR